MIPATIPTVQTERLTLRAPQMRDFDAYAAFRASDRAAFVGGPYDRESSFQALSAIAGQWQLRGYGRWMIADRATDAPQGIAGVFHPVDWPEPEIAWSVFEAAEGRGIAFEAAQAARAYAYDTLKFPAIISMIDPKNRRSVALAKRMGASPESTFQHATYGTMHIWRHPGPEAVQ